MPNITHIVAAIVDTHNLTLYKENGDTITFPQGDPRIRSIVDEAVPLLMKQGYADINISPAGDNSYIEFEALSNGVVKLYRIAKSKLVSLIGADATTVAEEVETVMPMAIGYIPVATATQQTLSVVEEIMQHAVSVSSPDFHEEGLAQQGNIVEESGFTIGKHSADTEPDTIIAVVDGKIIPGMEKIKTQFTRAAKLGSTIGVENFIRRLSSVIDERKHSVDDLLKFMERGDLPIADDGSILIYKVLTLQGKKFVDCHSKKVEQWVGAYVCMDVALVDHNRSNECSNGLHVARRGYISGFSGNACVLAKLAPEDVIAVPTYDANKMRVCGYHIIAELSADQYQLVKVNKPISDDPAGQVLLGKALAGQHIGKTHEVRITGQMGAGVVVTALDAPVMETTETPVVVPVAEALANPDAETKDTPINPNDVVKQVEQLSRKDIAAKLYAEGDLVALKAFKKAAKVSWEKLGVPDPDLVPTPEKAKTTFKELVSAAADAIEVFGEDTLERFRNEQKANETSTKRVVNGVELGEGSPRERIQKLLSIGVTSVGVAKAILELKKKSKKSWESLGIAYSDSQNILKLTATA